MSRVNVQELLQDLDEIGLLGEEAYRPPRPRPRDRARERTTRPAPEPERPAPEPERPAPEPERPASVGEPAPEPERPASAVEEFASEIEGYVEPRSSGPRGDETLLFDRMLTALDGMATELGALRRAVVGLRDHGSIRSRGARPDGAPVRRPDPLSEEDEASQGPSLSEQELAAHKPMVRRRGSDPGPGSAPRSKSETLGDYLGLGVLDTTPSLPDAELEPGPTGEDLDAASDDVPEAAPDQAEDHDEPVDEPEDEDTP